MNGAYKKLPSDEEDEETSSSIQHSRRRGVCFGPLMVHGALLLLNVSLILLIMVFPGDRQAASWYFPDSELSSWDPSLRSLSSKPTKFKMHWKLDPPSSVYGGAPRPETDKAWDRMTANEWIDGTAVVLSVDEESIARARKIDDPAWLNTTVKLGAYSDKGGYMGTLDMFHQLHCLNMVRKVVYRDYYEPRSKMFQKNEFWQHIDHCLETLRESLMCIGNTELVTFHWVKGWPGPVPDFNVWHQCRDPEEILEWANKRAVDIKKPLVKPAGVVELEERP